MSRSYTAMTTLIKAKLQSSVTTLYSVADVNNAIEDGLKEFSTYIPHIVPMIFKIESRDGIDVTGTADKLTDSVKAQFTTDDAEKVVHNITQNKWATITARDSTSVLSINANIMAANESYEIYNEQCWNKRQIYIGDVPENYEVHSVEYPIGTRRNWTRYDKVLELDVKTVADSDSTLTNLGDVDVLIRFEKPHVLSQLTDFAGKMADTAASAATSISSTSWQTSGTIETGEEFTIQNHRSVYVVAASATIGGSTAAISLYPPLEAAVSSTAWTIAIRETSLRPRDEDIFADLCAARLSINAAPKYFNTTVTGAGDVPGKYFDWGERKLAETLMKLTRMQPPKTKRRYATA